MQLLYNESMCCKIMQLYCAGNQVIGRLNVCAYAIGCAALVQSCVPYIHVYWIYIKLKNDKECNVYKSSCKATIFRLQSVVKCECANCES